MARVFFLLLLRNQETFAKIILSFPIISAILAEIQKRTLERCENFFRKRRVCRVKLPSSSKRSRALER